jgi:hypothetical protein
MKGSRLLMFIVLCWLMMPAYRAEARYYDARVGRFLTVDPLQEKYPQWAAYSYCFCNPAALRDPDGKKVVLGSWWDRTLSFFGYKTDGLRYVEKAAERLKQSESGAKIFAKVDDLPQDVVVKTDILEQTTDNIELGRMDPKGDQKNDKFEGATIVLDPNHIETAIMYTEKNMVTNEDDKYPRKDASAIVLGHELGHAAAAASSVKKYSKEVNDGVSEEKQAKPIERNVRKELSRSGPGQ